ncbi:MAG: hypothetical protein WC761_05930 [Candidatus Paceibacterota bacterium]|jgi:hypothetical protein
MNKERKLNVLVYQDGKEVKIDKKEILKQLGVASLIRIPESEYESIDSSKEYFAHFNLGHAEHEVGSLYALPRILRGGKLHGGVETPPLLSFDNIYIAECVEVEYDLLYEKLEQRHFIFSTNGIKDAESLKDAIVRRYSQSRPDYSKEELLSKGVTFTLLKFVKKI